LAVITLLNQKGGVGKTSTCHHLSGTLAQLGRRILLIDNDPQASLTQGLFGPQATRDLGPETTIAAIYAGEAGADQVIRRATIAGVDIVPGSRFAMKYNNAEPWTADRDRQMALREVVEQVAGHYDLILIDCPPNLHLCSWASLVTSDHVIVPLQPEDYGAQGIIDIQESVALVQRGPNPDLRLLGYLITMYQARRTVHRIYDERLRELYGSAVFATRIPEAAEFPEAIMQRQTIAQYKPRGAAAKAIAALTAELLERLATCAADRGAA
jgi:chromosome partitioning protein